MLTKEEQDFVDYWGHARERESGFMIKLLRGLPVAVIFTAPIILSIVLVYLFSPNWYTKISPHVADAVPTTLVAFVIIVVFFSYFRMHFKWEQKEQLYKALKQKLEDDAAK